RRRIGCGNRSFLDSIGLDRDSIRRCSKRCGAENEKELVIGFWRGQDAFAAIVLDAERNCLAGGKSLSPGRRWRDDKREQKPAASLGEAHPGLCPPCVHAHVSPAWQSLAAYEPRPEPIL